MLQFILGRSRSGKTEYIKNRITEICKNEDEQVILIVPEQFTYETEKNLFKELGSNIFRRVKVTSFTRLSNDIFKEYGFLAGDYADDSAKQIIMDIAINEIKDSFEIYEKSSKMKTFSKTILDTVTELKNAGVSPSQLMNTANSMEEGYLKKKSKEISLIYSTYNALLLMKYLDPLDDITRATKLVQSTDFFKGYTAFFDEFKSFTANENEIIKTIISSSKDSYFALCLDLKEANENENSIFSPVYDTYNKIKRFARDVSVNIKPSITVEGNYSSAEIAHIEKNLFHPKIKCYTEECNKVKAVTLKNEYDEVDYCLATIYNLVKDEGYSYNDIAIVSRDFDSYQSPLEAGFKKYNLPYFMDKREGIANKPLICFVKNALNCVTKGYTAENILSLLKTAVIDFSMEEIALFENYIYIWDIKGSRFNDNFTANPRGYQEDFLNNDTEILEIINHLREFIITKLNDFKEETKNVTGDKISQGIVHLLESMNVKEKMEQIISEYLSKDNFILADEYTRVWDMLMEILNTMAICLKDNIVTVQRFENLFDLVISTCEMGSLPQSLDTIIAGSAERIRLSDKKAIFVLGVNEKVFPFVPTQGGLFTDKERQQLIDLDINISKPIKEAMKEERFIAYKILTMPKERLYITARKADIMGKSMLPSIIFIQLKKMFSEDIIIDEADIDLEYFCKTYRSAYFYLAKNYYEDTEFTASLKEALSKKQEYAERITHLDRVTQNKDFVITDKNNAKKLFGKEMNISPTRVETFYQCHFRYFCEHGLRVFPLKKAELNPLETGTLIHSILYSVTKNADLKENYNKEEINSLVKRELDYYIEHVMGGSEDKTKRFLYLYNRMRISILKIIEQLHIELMQSKFSPIDFEYEISKDSEIMPLKLIGDDNTIINVQGKIDRIDCFTNKEGKKYIRIIDYKSGKKQFNLNDVLYGLNLQMLIYLHCISDHSKGSFKDALPAGILYMPAGETPPTLKREATNEEIELQKVKNYTMNGLLIKDNEILEGMEESMQGLFIPITLKKDGDFTKASLNSLITLSELSKINRYIDKLIIDMASELHKGKIEAFPIEDSCTYCNYKGVCGITKTSKVREYIKYDKEQILKEIGKEEQDG